ncbi:hypothetical protein Q8F55_002060 [Vanrija albida]|uniref:Uncharacterized protein n=1 Tax=Vanrija albida TaxID=181172 RepID=A0ABR3Q8Y6_9TREE
MSVASARREPSPAPPSILLNCGRIGAPRSASASPSRVGIGFGAASPSRPVAAVKSSESLDIPSGSSATLSPGFSVGTSLSSETSWGSAPDDSPKSTLNTLPNGNGVGSSTPRSISSTIASSPKIRFGECPERPPELRRRNSITLGVLARKNMLHAQGTVSAASGARGAQQGHIRSVHMTDAEWTEYQRQFAQKSGPQAVDLGTVMTSGAKKLWGKVRRGSSSNASNASINSTQSAAPVMVGASRLRSDSAPGAPQPTVSPLVRPMDHTIAEEDEQPPTPVPGLGLDTGDGGEQTPRRGRSPSPPPPTFDDDDEDDDDEEASEPADETVSADDAEATHRQHQGHTTAVLGFELSEYAGNPAWDAEMRERQDVARLAHGLGQARGSPAVTKAPLDEAPAPTATSPPVAIRRHSNSHARYAAEAQRRRESAARERRLSTGSSSASGTSPVSDMAAHMPRLF